MVTENVARFNGTASENIYVTIPIKTHRQSYDAVGHSFFPVSLSFWFPATASRDSRWDFLAGYEDKTREKLRKLRTFDGNCDAEHLPRSKGP